MEEQKYPPPSLLSPEQERLCKAEDAIIQALFEACKLGADLDELTRTFLLFVQLERDERAGKPPGPFDDYWTC
jgi:hypothetical protein